MSTGIVSFMDKNEEIETINSIFNSFTILKDKDLTQKWLFSNQDHYNDFMDYLAEIVVTNLIILQGNKEVFQKGIIENQAFISKLNALSPQIAKLMIVLIQSFKNDFKPKKYKHLDKKEVETMFEDLSNLFKSKIDYDFMFNKKVKIPFKVENN
jgi:hypothetical protein